MNGKAKSHLKTMKRVKEALKILDSNKNKSIRIQKRRKYLLILFYIVFITSLLMVIKKGIKK